MDPTPSDRNLVDALIQAGKLAPDQGEALLAQTLGSQSELDATLVQTRVLSPDALDTFRGWREGARIADYLLEARLGQGGAGEVWRVTHVPTGAPRALKALLPFADAEDRLRLAREAEALAALDGHPHVLRVHSAGVAAGRAYLVLDLARGESLAELVRRTGPMPPEDARALILALASGLRHVHSRGYLHRDLKPQNVLFADDGRPLLSDFGLVRAEDSSLTRSGAIYGTPGYMAPEQARGEPVDERADVYGLGAVLYFALTGHAPFRGKTLTAVLDAVVNLPPTPPSELVPGLPPELEAACLGALAKDPAARPGSARALAEALRARPPRPTTAKVAALGAGLVLAALAGLVAVWAARAELPSTEPASSKTIDAPDPGASAPDLAQAFVSSFDRAVLYPAHQRASSEPPSRVASELAAEGAPLADRIGFLVLAAEADAHTWVEVAEQVLEHPPLTPELTPDQRRRLALQLLERGISRGSSPCAVRFARALLEPSGDAAPEVDRAFALLQRTLPKPEHPDYPGHVLALVTLALEPPAPLKDPPDDLELLELTARAFEADSAPDPATTRRLCAARYTLERRVGAAHLDAVLDLDPRPDDWELIRSLPSRAYLSDGEALLLGGQELFRRGPDPSDPHARPRQALLCFAKSCELGELRAWHNIAYVLKTTEDWAHLGTKRERDAAVVEARWRGTLAGRVNAISATAYLYATRALEHPAELVHLRTALEQMPGDRARDAPDLALTQWNLIDDQTHFAIAVAVHACLDPAPLVSREQALGCVEDAAQKRVDNRERSLGDKLGLELRRAQGALSGEQPYPGQLE